MTFPSLTIIIPNYNHEKHLKRCLNSIFNQTLKPNEVIVVDDGSTDDSIIVIEEFLRREESLKLIKNEKNIGGIQSVHKALKIAKGEYIFFRSADDFEAPTFIEKSLKLLEKYPNAGLCCCDPATVNSDTGVELSNSLFWSDKACYLSPNQLCEVINGGYIAGHTTIYKKSALENVGGIINELEWHGDWFASLNIAFRFGICYIPEPLSYLTVDPNSYSASGRKKNPEKQQKIIYDMISLLLSKEYEDTLPYFILGSSFSHFNTELPKVIAHNRNLWATEVLLLTQHSFSKRLAKIDEYNKSREGNNNTDACLAIIGKYLDNGQNAIKENKLIDALNIFNELLSKFPHQPYGLYYKALLNVELKDKLVSKNTIDELFVAANNNIQLLTGVASLYFKIQEYKESNKACLKVIKLDNNNLSAHIQMAANYSFLGEHDKAYEHSHFALDIDPTNKELIVNTAKLAIQANNKKNATELLNKAKESNIESAEINHLLEIL